MKTSKTITLLTILISLTVLTSSCFTDCITGIRGSGPIVSEDIYLGSVTGIDLQISGNVVITGGQQQEITIKAQQNIIDNIEHNVRGGKWIIEFDRNVRHHDGITIYVTIPEINELEISGSGNITSNSNFTNHALELKISGSGDISFNAEVNSIYTSISGSGNVNLLGLTEYQEVHISGSGNYYGYSFISDECDINISVSGNSKVYVNDKLDARISGSGNIYYKGYPSVISNISGSGNIISVN